MQISKGKFLKKIGRIEKSKYYTVDLQIKNGYPQVHELPIKKKKKKTTCP